MCLKSRIIKSLEQKALVLTHCDVPKAHTQTCPLHHCGVCQVNFQRKHPPDSELQSCSNHELILSGAGLDLAFHSGKCSDLSSFNALCLVKTFRGKKLQSECRSQPVSVCKAVKEGAGS